MKRKKKLTAQQGTEYFFLESAHVDPARLKKEREKARALRKTSWWKEKLQKGVCHYCQDVFLVTELTMDHIVPLARGGSSTKSNVVPACKKCNQDKKLKTPAEALLDQLNKKNKS